jgi:hypothetical protein
MFMMYYFTLVCKTWFHVGVFFIFVLIRVSLFVLLFGILACFLLRSRLLLAADEQVYRML